MSAEFVVILGVAVGSGVAVGAGDPIVLGEGVGWTAPDPWQAATDRLSSNVSEPRVRRPVARPPGDYAYALESCRRSRVGAVHCAGIQKAKTGVTASSCVLAGYGHETHPRAVNAAAFDGSTCVALTPSLSMTHSSKTDPILAGYRLKAMRPVTGPGGERSRRSYRERS